MILIIMYNIGFIADEIQRYYSPGTSLDYEINVYCLSSLMLNSASKLFRDVIPLRSYLRRFYHRTNLPRVNGSRCVALRSMQRICESSYSGKSQFLSSTRKLFVLQPLHLRCRDGVIMPVTKEATEITLIGLMEILGCPFNLCRQRFTVLLYRILIKLRKYCITILCTNRFCINNGVFHLSNFSSFLVFDVNYHDRFFGRQND